MSESLGIWLRRERERRGVSLKSIADQTKLAVPLLEGLEADDLSRWPGGIYRRAFVRSYATAVGLQPDEVIKRFEREHGTGDDADNVPAPAAVSAPGAPATGAATTARSTPRLIAGLSQRARVVGTLADLTVALVLGLGSAAAGSRLLWPVLLIAAYYGLGVLLTGTSPMVALLNDAPGPVPPREEPQPAAVSQQRVGNAPAGTAAVAADRRGARRAGGRPVRVSRSRPHVQ